MTRSTAKAGSRAVFSEYRDVQQERSGRRRWFVSEEEVELIVWYDDAGRELGFQIGYALEADEWALTWRHRSGFAHGRVDTGDHSPLKNETPILVADGPVPWTHVQTLFDRHGATLAPELRTWIAERLALRA